MKLSDKLNAIANADCFYGESLYAAYESEIITTEKDKRVLSRYMHGSELTADRFHLQDLAIRFAMKGK
jgi:hypothetical protein